MPVAERKGKFLRVSGGVMLMTAFVIIALIVVTRYAGDWGVPYFSFETENGSTCKNTLTGFDCTEVSQADLELWAEVKLPPQTKIKEAEYLATHDYQLTAVVEFPKAAAAAGLKSLNTAYGKCLPSHVSPLDTKGLSQICVMSNDAVTEAGTASSRLYIVGTGVRKDGSRVAAFQIRSR